MGQLIASIVLMYLVVGAAGYWGMRKRRELAERPDQMDDSQTNEKAAG